MLYKRVILHQPTRSIGDELAQFLGESFSAPTVLRSVKRMATLLGDLYDLLMEEVQKAACVHVDETGCPLNGEQWWTWVFVTKTVVVYRIAKSRGHTVVKEVLRDFQGTLVSDFYTAYDPLPYAKQKCLVHLLRRLEAALKRKEEAQGQDKGSHLEDYKELRVFISEVAELFQGAIKEAKERARRETEQTETKKEVKSCRNKEHKVEAKTPCGSEKHVVEEKEKWIEKRRKAERRLDQLLEREYSSSEVKKLVKLLKKHKESLFTFLEIPEVGWENNAAERALRPVVVQRKRSGGFRSDESAQAHAVLYSIAGTCRMRGESFIEVLTGVGWG